MKTILVVDDDNAQRTILQKELEPEGYRVRLAESGSEALDLIRKEMIDLVVLDIRMPEMDGVEATRRIVAAGKAAGTLAVDEAMARRYLDWGATFVAVGLDTVTLARETTRLAKLFKGQA